MLLFLVAGLKLQSILANVCQHKNAQTCHISGFRPEITGLFIALPALRLSCKNLRQNHKISGVFFLGQHFKIQLT